MGKVVALLSYIGTGFLLAITLVRTHPELDVQDWYFVWAVIGLSVAALLTAAHSKKTGRFSVMDGLVWLFLLYLLVNYQLISQVDASSKWLQTVYFAVLYGSLRILLPAYRHMEKFLIAAILFCGLWEAILGLMQAAGFRASLHHNFAFTGTYVNTGPYGGFLATSMAVALGFMVRYYPKFNRQCKLMKQYPLPILRSPDFALYLLSALSFCIAFTVFFAAMSRAAILGLLVSAVVVVCTQPYAKRWLSNFFSVNRKKKIIMFAVVSALLLVGMGAGYYLKKASADGRLLIWKVSAQVMAQKPVFGSGLGSFFGAYHAGSAAYFAEHPESPSIPIADVPEYSFNEYLQTGVETGMVGMLLLLSILFLALYRLIRAKSLFAYGLIVVMIFAIFSFPFSQLPFPILLVVFIAAAGCPSSGAAGRAVPVAFCTVLVIIGLGLSGMYREKIEAAEAWKQARMLYRMQHYREAGRESAALYPLLKDNPRFLFEYGHALNRTERFAQSNAILREGAQLSSDPMFYNVMGNNYKGLGDYERAAQMYRYAFNILPNRIYPLYLLMKLYADTGQEEKAGEMAQKVVDFPPKIDSPAVRDMKREAMELIRRYVKH
ncbi:MAG: O-antigen ligase family protein [Bacteroidales bacterium]|nr:O-antigen ligase family protein [Bacteroidales bacterium]MCL2739195.1 O-antigen ligase family protein [Bacteroidales bacterium]